VTTICGRLGVVAVSVGVGVGVGVGDVVGVGVVVGVGLGDAVGEAVGVGTGSSAGLALTDAAHTKGTTETAAAISGISRLAERTKTPDGSAFLGIKGFYVSRFARAQRTGLRAR
jgi:hypothetical protein